MKTLNDFLKEEDDDKTVDSRKSLIQFITANFYRLAQQQDLKNDRGMLLLIAAISMLSVDDDTQIVNTAKRLAQLALTQSGKSKKEK